MTQRLPSGLEGDSGRHQSVLRQLRAPSDVGRDLELFRTRLYRFSNDRDLYVLGDCLADRYLVGRRPTEQTMAYVRSALTALRHGRPLPAPDMDVWLREGIDLVRERTCRASWEYGNYEVGARPTLVVAIIGAPRSGTSHLVNLLARTGAFAYFTTASCWAWPVRNLRQEGRLLLHELSSEVAEKVLAVDNKVTRIIPGLVMPGEAEDVYARAVPVYRHLGGHSYEITRPVLADPTVLRAGVAAHLELAGTSLFLTKSPFNSFRIPALERVWGGAIRYIHIVRDRAEVARSLRRNHFAYHFDGAMAPAEEAWERFVDAAGAAPRSRLLALRYRDLAADQESVIRHVLRWLDVHD